MFVSGHRRDALPSTLLSNIGSEQISVCATMYYKTHDLNNSRKSRVAQANEHDSYFLHFSDIRNLNDNFINFPRFCFEIDELLRIGLASAVRKKNREGSSNDASFPHGPRIAHRFDRFRSSTRFPLFWRGCRGQII